MSGITRLKLKILERGMTQKEVAERAGINRGLFSLICSGKLIADEKQKERIAAVIQLPKDELFEQVYRL